MPQTAEFSPSYFGFSDPLACFAIRQRAVVYCVAPATPCTTLRIHTIRSTAMLLLMCSMTPKQMKDRPMPPRLTPRRLCAETIGIKYLPTRGDQKILPMEYMAKLSPTYAPEMPFCSSISGRMGAHTEYAPFEIKVENRIQMNM